ncbi:hypothetical protein SNE40_004012 [Patella caerulea]|uniref:Uncharacterized protein n=1 Tax=Patella caerulea TaxID=87958 RepID=A0AAN8KHZ8_PATCE
MPNTGALQYNSVNDISFSRQQSFADPCLFTVAGTHGSMYRPYSMGQTSHAPNTIQSFGSMETSFGEPFEDGLNIARSSFPSPMVETEGGVLSGYSSCKSSESISNLDGCKQFRMGRPFFSGESIWSLEQVRTTEAYKLVRTYGSFQSPQIVCSSHTAEECVGSYRQFYSSSLYQQARGDSLTRTVFSGMGDAPLVYGSQDSSVCSTYPWSEKCIGRQSVTESQNSDDRVVFGPRYSTENFLPSRLPQYRFVCNISECSTSSVLFPLSTATSVGLRCPFNFVDRHVGLCISSSCVSPKGTVQSQVRGLCTYSNSTMVPETVLVSSTPGSVDRPAMQASDLQGSVISEQRPVSSQLPRSIKFGGVENFKQSRPKKKFSSSASRFIEGARRPSTRRLYDSRILAFREWCKSKKISAGSASVEKIADFFVHLHKTKGCQYNRFIQAN